MLNEPRPSETILEPLETATELDLVRQVLEFAIAGWLLEDIADAIGLSPEDTKPILKKAMVGLKKYTTLLAADLREFETARLEVATKAIWPKVLQGNLAAVKTYLEISKRRSALWGLDAPTKLALTDPTGNHEGKALIQIEYVTPNTAS